MGLYERPYKQREFSKTSRQFIAYQRRVWVFECYKTVISRWPVKGQLKKEHRWISSIKKKPKGQNPTKFKPLDKKVRNEDIIKTWKLSQYTPLLSLSTKPSQSTCLYLIKPTTTLPVKSLLQQTHILHCTLIWYSLHLLDLWNALLYVHCNLMFWYVEGFQIKNVCKYKIQTKWTPKCVQ